MNSVFLLVIGLLWLVRIPKIVRRSRARAGADLLAENLARILAGQLARGVTGSEAVLSASAYMSDRRTARVLGSAQAQVRLGRTASEGLRSSMNELQGIPVIVQLWWFFDLVADSGASADVLSQFADRVADDRHHRSELHSQTLEARTTSVALPIVAVVMASSILTANHASRLVLGTSLGLVVIAGASAVVAVSVGLVLRMTKI